MWQTFIHCIARFYRTISLYTDGEDKVVSEICALRSVQSSKRQPSVASCYFVLLYLCNWYDELQN